MGKVKKLPRIETGAQALCSIGGYNREVSKGKIYSCGITKDVGAQLLALKRTLGFFLDLGGLLM